MKLKVIDHEVIECVDESCNDEKSDQLGINSFDMDLMCSSIASR